jgi:hypothetical protein
MHQGSLFIPMPTIYTTDFSVIQYEDDTFIVMPADPRDLQSLGLILDELDISIGLM